MSLLEALLTEGYRDPHEVYISLRADGQKGSGTIDDPYDGGTRPAAPFQGSLTFNRNEFVVQAPNGLRGLSAGGGITITHVHGPAATWFNNQAFTIADILENQIVGGAAWPRIFTVIGSSTPPAPPDVQFNWNNPAGSRITLGYTDSTTLQAVSVEITIDWPVAKVVCAQDQGLVAFDAVTINNISDASFAGTFPILGAHGTSHSFRYRLTCSTLPADIIPNQTTPDHLDCTVTKIIHRFDEVMRSVPSSSVVHIGPGTFETRGAAPIYIANEADWNQLHVGFPIRAGQRLLGSGVGATTLKLVLPIDEINQTTAITHFPFSLAPNADHVEVADLMVDCNALGHAAPYGIFPAPVTCGAVSLAGSFIRVHRVRVIHFCVQARAECFGIILSGGVFNVVEDCILERPGLNNTHETTLLSAGGDVYGSAVSPIARHNYANCSYVKEDDGTSVSSQYVAVASITQQTSGNPELFVVVTKRPHNRDATKNVLINGVTPSSHVLNAAFPVVQKDSDTQLVFKLTGAANPVAAFVATSAYIGVDFHGPLTAAGTGCVVEGNAVFDCAQGLYTDTGSTRDAVVRDNYYSNVLNGVNFDFNPYGLGAVTAVRIAKIEPDYASLTRSVINGKFIATFEIPDDVPPGTSAPLQVTVGDAVTVGGARTGDPSQPAPEHTYNGTFAVMSVSSDKRKFSYEMISDPGDHANPPTTGLPILFQSRYQVRRFVYENNICHLYKFDSDSAPAPRAVSTFGYEQGPPYMFPQAVIRDNLFRLGDGSIAPSSVGAPYLGLRLDSCENYLIEGNVIDIPDDNPIHYLVSRTINAFNNQTSSGQPSPLSEDPAANNVFVKRDTLEDKVSDAVLFSLV